MPSSPLSIDTFPAWTRLNDVEFKHVKLANVDGKGLGLITETGFHKASSESMNDHLSNYVLKIPKDLLLSAEAVEDYCKVDQNFKLLLEAAGNRSTRSNIMIYLLSHLVLSRKDLLTTKGGTPTSWTEYVRFLPRTIPVPTMWTNVERSLLNGTSLEIALRAKLSVLNNEFEELRETSSNLPFWEAFFWEHATVTFEDWILVDAWYRSRCLELPRTGETMVPTLDMVNHSHTPSAYYDENGRDDIVLLPRPTSDLSMGDEITISYGESKSAAEMLFSYGFIDRQGDDQSMTLNLEPFPDDPLGKAKLHVFDGAPIVKLTKTTEGIKWDSPFVYLMCLNEEDGLDFRLLQDMTGQQQLRIFWQDEDVTDKALNFESLVQGQQLHDVFKLRAVAVLHERVVEQLESNRQGPSQSQLEPLVVAELVRESCVQVTQVLREVEAHLLRDAAAMLENEKSQLLALSNVVDYLGLMEDAPNDEVSTQPTNDEDDFS